MNLSPSEWDTIYEEPTRLSNEARALRSQGKALLRRRSSILDRYQKALIPVLRILVTCLRQLTLPIPNKRRLVAKCSHIILRDDPRKKPLGWLLVLQFPMLWLLILVAYLMWIVIVIAAIWGLIAFLRSAASQSIESTSMLFEQSKLILAALTSF